MSTIKVCSRLLNSVEFSRYQEKKDKHGLPYKEAIGKKIVIEGVNAYEKKTGLKLPYVFTEIQADDWEMIKATMGHCTSIKHGHIFVGKNEKETTIQAVAESDIKNRALYGNEPIKLPTVNGVEVS